MTAAGDPDQLNTDEQRRISAALGEIVERRGAIEQAKGMLMMVYSVDADEAFGLLRWQSQLHNVKLHLLAARIVEELIDLGKTQPLDRSNANGVVLTAHQRIGDSAQFTPQVP